PVLNAEQSVVVGSSDAFMVKYTSAGADVWATFLGGGGDDPGYGIAVDSSGNAYVTGETEGGLPSFVLNAQQGSFGGGSTDAFVAKYTSGGTKSWATYLGGSGADTGRGMAVDS